MEEAEFRKRVQEIFDFIEGQFEAIDPDVAECTQAQGSLTITFGAGTRCILSTQPSLRQIWLALASKGLAFHFNFEPITRKWLDDKGRPIELINCVSEHVKETCGIKLP
ncbi:iron donor protein CyaY [Bdellovibrionota bacterium FG-2]